MDLLFSTASTAWNLVFETITSLGYGKTELDPNRA
jgi:hypothetical protein